MFLKYFNSRLGIQTNQFHSIGFCNTHFLTNRFPTMGSTDANRLDLHIEYELAGKSGPHNLVYPFYLRTADDGVSDKP